MSLLSDIFFVSRIQVLFLLLGELFIYLYSNSKLCVSLMRTSNFFLENKFACLSLSIETKFVYSSIFLCEIDAGGRNGELSGPCPLQSDSDLLPYF